MKTWDDWSDFDVNAFVTMHVYNLHDWEYSENMQQFFHCGVTGDETYTQNVIDYCNNWSYMGPLAINSNIVITPCMGSNNGDATGYFEHKNPITIDFCVNDKALRAAAIVFLMMNGVKP